MNFVETVRQRSREHAQKHSTHLVLPEGSEERNIRAAAIILQKKIAARVSLLGSPVQIQKNIETFAVDLKGVEFIDPVSDEHRRSYGREYHKLRKHKGMTEEQAFIDMSDPLRWGCMMLRRADADALVAGAENSTADVLRAAFGIVKTKSSIRAVSSCFVMIMDDTSWGSGGKLIFSDCAILPRPNADQLADIALAAAESCRMFLGEEPVIAMLSFSTMGSAETDDTRRVVHAVEMVKNRDPTLLIDGEMQVDAALVPDVGDLKAPGSSVAGRANTLIFPDLQSGNIAYKLVQRLAHAKAIGPILQGLEKPVSDLSRGCSVEDIVNAAALTIIQSKK